MVNLIQDNTVEDEDVINRWITSLSFAKHPTKEMVTNLMELADQEIINKNLFFTVTTIIKNYCNHVNRDCKEETEITGALNFFEDLLGSRCRYSDKQEKRKMIVALHALGNAGIYRRSIRKCYESESTDIALRVAALQAIKEMSCETQEQDGMIAILMKTSQDSELRISAYKALMSCPRQEVLDVVVTLLDEEMSNQVGSYIVSHMKNIQGSEDPLKAEQRAVLQDHPITAKFLDDPMKFSHNAEWSWYNETTGYGIGGEGDIIFSSNSFLPRQMSAKGQFDAFGYAFEAFELGGRVEGLERLLESVFASGKDEGGEEESRQRRSLIKETKMRNLIEDFEMLEGSEADGHVYLKMFGNAVTFHDTEDFKEMFATKTPEEYITKLAMLAVGETYEISQGMTVAEHKLSVPLVNGLELRMSVNVSSTQRLKASGKLNILGLAMDPRSFEIDGTVEPSASADVSCLMEVDAHCARIGVNYELAAHTATSLSGKIAYDGGNLKLQMRAPEQKQELVSISSKVFFLHQEKMDIIPTSVLPLTQEKICTGEYLEDAIGFQVCGESKYHLDEMYQWPLVSSSAFNNTCELLPYGASAGYDCPKNRVRLPREYEGVDCGLESSNVKKILAEVFKRPLKKFSNFVPYIKFCRTFSNMDSMSSLSELSHEKKCIYEKILWKMVENQKEETDNFHLMFGTPNTQRQRTYGLDWSFNRLSREFTADLTCPHHISHLEASRTNEENHQRVQVTWTVNEDSVYSMYFNFEKSMTGDETNYYPTMRIHSPQFGTLQLLGSVINTPTGVRLDVSFQGETRKFITVDGDITKIQGNKKSRYTTDLTIGGEYMDGSIASVVQDIHQDFFLSCEFSNSPESSFRIDGEILADGLESQSTLKFCYGQTSCSGNKKLILTHSMAVEQTDDALTNSFTVTLQHPNQGTHLVLSQSLQSQIGMTDFSIQVVDKEPSTPVTLVGTSLGLVHERNDAGKSGSFEVSLSTPGSIKRISQVWNRENSDVSATTTVQWQEDRKVMATVSYSKTQETGGVNVNAIITLPEMSTRGVEFSLVRAEGEGTARLTISSDDESLFMVEGTGSKGNGGTGGSGSLTVNTPFHVLSDFKVGFNLEKEDAMGFDSTLSFTLLPEGNTWSIRVEKESHQSEGMTGSATVTLTSPMSTGKLNGFVQTKVGSGKGGLSWSMLTEGSEEKVFGIETRVTKQTEGSARNIAIRVNTTAPYHKNSVEVTLKSEDCDFDFTLDVEYGAGIHFISSVALEKKENAGGFIFNTSVNAPFQRGTLKLDHAVSQGHLFNPHLTVEVASFDFDMTLVDINLKVTTDETLHGKDHQLFLQVSGPGKTLILTTGLTRNEHGLDYFVQLANPEEVRFRIDLDTSIQVEDTFRTHVGLSASSIYAPEWPVKCGIDMEKDVDNVGFVVFFNVLDEPLFHFNVTRSITNESPRVLNADNIGVRVKLPTSVIPSLHHFGMHILREESLSDPNNIPLKSGSLSFFWGPESNQQLTISSVSSVQNTEENLLVEGSLVLVQPLRTIHLLPEYSLDYSLSKAGPQLMFSVEYDHGQDDASTFEITHSEQETSGKPNYITSVTATLQQGKRFSVASNLTFPGDSHVKTNVVFDMNDGDHQEHAELSLDAKQYSELTDFELSFEHDPSGFDLASIMSIRNNDASTYFGLEADCSIPDLEGPAHLGIEIDLDKATKELMFHVSSDGCKIDPGEVSAAGHGKLLILKATAVAESMKVVLVQLTISLSRVTFSTEHRNQSAVIVWKPQYNINDVKRPFNVQCNLTRICLDVIFETKAGEHKLHTSYLNDSAIQTTLTKNGAVNAQHTISIWNPHPFTTYHWETTWPMTIQEAAVERLEAMRENREVTWERYQEIGRVIRDGFSSYMERTTLRNDELIQRLRETGEGIRERMEEIRDNYRMQRSTIQRKFEEFAETSRSNLAPLVAEYEDMTSSGSGHLETIRYQISEGSKNYFKRVQIVLTGYQLSILGAVAEEYMDLNDMLGESLEQDREMIDSWKREKAELLWSWSDIEIDWMRTNWESAREDVKLRWEEFLETMSGMINRDEWDNMVFAYQLSPMFGDTANLGSTMIDVQSDIEDRLEVLREEREQSNLLKEKDASAFRRMMSNFHLVRSAFNGYKYLANIEDGRIEVWLFTDQRFDDLVSLPVNDPLSGIKILGLRLAEEFPLIADARQFKSQLYNNSELVMEYYYDVAEFYWDKYYNTGASDLELLDVWQWNGIINTALYDMFASQSPKGEAMLLGDQHYKTFDGTHYTYAGKCSFMLAQDFVDNNFTIAVEYSRKEGVMSKSFTVISDGNTFEIKDGRVYSDGDVLELPFSTRTAEITRDYSKIYITSSKGFKASYNVLNDIFQVQISIFYFGKTAGLFGNFNYEPHDDLLKSSGVVTTHVDEFARSWEIGKKCDTHLDKSITCDDTPSIRENRECAQMFLDGLGPASAGHPAVNPEPFYKACVNSVCGDLTYVEVYEKRCSAFQAYVEACKHAGLTWLEIPRECVRCATPEGDSFIYDRYYEEPRGVDIVVIMEQASCMSGKSRHVARLMEVVNSALRNNQGLTENRFGLVGFGGNGTSNDPHVETINGELYGTLQGIILGLNDMPFDGEEMSDAWAAVKFALNYPFRAAVPKHVILMSCSESTRMSGSAGSRRVQKAMNDIGITFSVLVGDSITLVEKYAHKDDGLFGYDETRVFTDKLAGLPADEFKGDKETHQYVQQIDNRYTRLAIETEGGVFSSNALNDKAFRDVFSMWVNIHSVSEDYVECNCSLQKNGVPQSHCSNPMY
ncbi:putative apolipophorins-like [Apostichopus japonicus]|uniref:Putative apolipophorins-like n=1 Tax=Stichopus japonicus TaxID=307972 RepID=A0A2G8JV85_STIJA|nr:putative apolipophorins-like [Apostichopus japonicus]